MEEIRECPFCGSKVVKMEEYAEDKHFIRCFNCKAEGPVDVDTMAVAKWNLPPRPGETVELPKDKYGAPIALGDTVYFSWDNEPVTVVRMTQCKEEREGWEVAVKGTGRPFLARPSQLIHIKPDSWKSIELTLKEIAGSDYSGEAALIDHEVELMMERIRRVAER